MGGGHYNALQKPRSSPNAVRDAKFKERFLRRFSTKSQRRASPNPEEEPSQPIAQAGAPPDEPSALVTAHPPSDGSPRLKTPEPPTVIVEGAVDEPAEAPKQASARDIQRQLGIDTPITADDMHEYWRQQSRTLSPPTRVPSDGSGPSFLSNSKQFVVDQCTFVDASHKTFGSAESVAFQFFRKRIARNALHDSADRFDPPKCDEDTRVGLIEEIMTWIDDSEAPSQIAVITGPAGSGKSAIQQTICETYAARNMLAGSFFFSVGDSSRNKHHPLFTTLIYQIAQTNKDLRPFIEQAVKDDPAVFDRSLETQVNILLIDSFQAASSYHTERLSKKWPRLLVVDGVDECRGEEMQLHLLQVINKCFVQRKLPFKIILASRPEYAIRTALETYLSSAYHIKLHEHNASSDIKLYFRRRLRALGMASNDPQANNGLWPTELIVDKLTDNSSGQFVYAATVVKYASNRRASPYLRIEQVLAWEPAIEQRRNPFAALDALYHNILIAAETAYNDDSEDERSVIDLLRELMLYNEASPFVTMSLSIHEFERFVRLRQGQVLDMLSDLHSLIKTAVADNDGFPELQIVLHHKSFSDYLQDPGRSTDALLQNYAVYTRLLHYTLTWLSVVDYEALDAICKGLLSSAVNITEEEIQIARFCLCNWPVYLFKSLMMDVSPTGQSGSQPLDKVLVDFFASDGWYFLKVFVRREGLFRCLPQERIHVRTTLLEDIWSWYLSQCVAVSSLHASQASELNEMLSCLKSCRGLNSSNSTPEERLSRPVMVRRGSVGVRPAGDFPHPRCIKVTLPPFLDSGSTTSMRPGRRNSEDGRWSGSTPLEATSSPADDEVPEERVGRVKAAGLPHRASVSPGSSRRDSEYYSCSSHFGSGTGIGLESPP